MVEVRALDICCLAALLDKDSPVITTLLGALIGAGASLLAHHKTAKHQSALEEMRLEAAHEDEWRRFRRDNLIRLQEAVQHAMRATGKCYLRMLKLAEEGKQWHEWVVDPVDSECQRKALEEVLLLSYRIDDADLVKKLTDFRNSVHVVMLDSQNATQLTNAVEELNNSYDGLMAMVGKRLGECVKGYGHSTNAD